MDNLNNRLLSLDEDSRCYIQLRSIFNTDFYCIILHAKCTYEIFDGGKIELFDDVGVGRHSFWHDRSSMCF